MGVSVFVCSAVTSAALVVLAAPAASQSFETVGTRAQGMGGAFVAVADDATATWWNPAGVATGRVFSLVLEQARLEEPPSPAPGTPAWRSRARGFATAFPALGLSHYRLRFSEIAPDPQATAGEAPDRQDEQAQALLSLRAIETNQYGMTVGQSLGQNIVVASTLKIVRAGVTSTDAGTGDALKRAETVDVRLHTRADLDLGVMATFGDVRLGIAVRNMREPRFGNSSGSLKLKRQARAGAAISSEWAGGMVAVALDGDLTRTATPSGDARRVAAGIETWLGRRQIGFRAGASANTVGAKGRSGSAGMSVFLGSGLYLEGAVTRGSDQARKGWAIGLSAAF